MSSIIRQLPDAISNQIAAGEVIQRPASAAKELLENSIDAGATDIRLLIRDAGKQLVQVIDDGAGMSPEDAVNCFGKHATSKIERIEDLFSLLTMGFRGEALASIAAVAQVELKTRRAEDELGTRILIEGSEIKSNEPCQAPVGTSISVKNLFFNIPARRNFLKSNPVETRHLIEEFNRQALAHPDIRFSLFQDDTEIHHLPPAKLRQRISGLFGGNYNERLVPMEEETEGLRISGFVGKPEHARKTRGEQYFFVNNRFIKSPYLNHAVYNVFQDYIPKERYPSFFIFIDIDPDKVDINVHPSKTEVKFSDERLVYTFINAGVKHALGQYSVTPTLDFDRESGFDNHSGFQSFPAAGPGLNTTVEQGDKRSGSLSYQPPASSGGKGGGQWEDLLKGVQEAGDRLTVTLASKADTESGKEQELFKSTEESAFQPVQLHNRYILTQIRSGFILIDQQAAHERILFEQYISQLAQGHKPSQQQLFPQKVELPPAQQSVLREILPELNNLGFDISDFGDGSFVLQGTPADLDVGDMLPLVDSLIALYQSNQQLAKLEKRENVARSLARSAAIKSGKRLNTAEMGALIDELFACENPYIAPNGHYVFISYELDELARRFES